MKAPAGGLISLFSHKMHSFFGKLCVFATSRHGLPSEPPFAAVLCHTSAGRGLGKGRQTGKRSTDGTFTPIRYVSVAVSYRPAPGFAKQNQAIRVCTCNGTSFAHTASRRNFACATSAITSLRDDEVTERAMVTKIIFSRSGHGPQTVLL
jgi:hypothetical protein